MKNTLVASAVAALLAVPAYAQQKTTSLDEIRRELAEISQRVQKLEQDKTVLEQQNAQLKAQNDELEATTEYLKDNAKANRKEIAEADVQVAKVADLEKASKSAEWASKIKMKGDFRFRHEFIEDELANGTSNERTRQRIRVRLGLEAKVNDTVKAVVQFATAGDDRDPRSTNQTLGEGATRKGIGLDLAYADWAPVNGVNVQLGKIPYAWQRVPGYIWDGDITWEGGAAKYANGAFFGSAYGFWLSEVGNGADANLTGAQVGFKPKFGDNMTLTAAVGYFKVGAVQGDVTLASAPTVAAPTTPTCVANPAFFGGAQGNRTVVVGGCRTLRDGYELIEGIAQLEFKLGQYPASVFANYIQNQDAVDNDTGYAAGLTFGKASDPQSWELGYVYQDVEQNAQFAQFIDSDFGGGITYSKGSVFKAAWAPAKNWTVNGTYFLNERQLVASGATNNVWRDYDRWQLDLNYKF